MKSPIDWLTMAYVVHQSFQLNEHITMPLMSSNESNFRLFLGDIGIFTYQSGINSASFISGDSNNTLSGIFLKTLLPMNLLQRELLCITGVERNIPNWSLLLNQTIVYSPLMSKRRRVRLILSNHFQIITAILLRLKFQPTIMAIIQEKNSDYPFLYVFACCSRSCGRK